jgi:ArsR family transcriptional regulator, arsenate/arsenite/antimonite-responsive transcriptional repressor
VRVLPVILPSFYQLIDGVAATMYGVGTIKTAPPAISPLAGEPIERADAERLAGVLKAFADPARLRLLSLIQSAPKGEASVSDLTAPLGLSQPTVSHHLRILTEAGLLERDKRGVWAYYRLVPSTIAAVADLLTPPRKRATRKTR